MSKRHSNQIDLRNPAGQRTVTVTPGNSVVFQFSAQQSRIGAGGGGKGMYNYIRGIVIQAIVNLTQPGSNGGNIPNDLIYGALGSFNLNTPLFGTLIDPNVVQNGIIAKHLMEFVGLGYKHVATDRAMIPAASGTSNVYFELYIPFAQAWNKWGDQFAHWLGWHDTSQLEIFVSNSADPFFQGQAGGGFTPATLNSVQISATLDMIPFNNVVVPPIVALRKYYQAAAANSNGPELIGVGNNGALQGCDDMARLMGMYYSHNAGGFVGSGTADQIATLTLPWRDQAQTLLPFGLFARFLKDCKYTQFGTSAVSATAPIAQMLDVPEPYAMFNNGTTNYLQPLNNNTARFTPLVWTPPNGLISQMQRVKGNYPLDMTFSSNQSGNFIVYTHELKQLSDSKCSELLAAMNIDPTTVSLMPLFGNKNVRFGTTSTGTPVVTGKVNAKKTFCLPRGVVLNQTAATATTAAAS